MSNWKWEIHYAAEVHGIFGCGVNYDISLLEIGEQLNDTLALGALAWAISFYVKREGTA